MKTIPLGAVVLRKQKCCLLSALHNCHVLTLEDLIGYESFEVLQDAVCFLNQVEDLLIERIALKPNAIGLTVVSAQVVGDVATGRIIINEDGDLEPEYAEISEYYRTAFPSNMTIIDVAKALCKVLADREKGITFN